MRFNEVEKVGTVRIGNYILNVYGDLNEPLFMASEIGVLIEYSAGNTYRLTQFCEDDEVLLLQTVVAGQRRRVTFVNELGLYNILEQSRMPVARKWRRVINEQIRSMRLAKRLNITQQFDEWNEAMDDIYFDEETGKLMRSVTVAGGDVIQVEA